MQFKKCTVCLNLKNVDDFYTSKYNSSGFRPNCKKCDNKKGKEYRKKNKKLVSVKSKIYNRKNKNKISQQKKEYYKLNRNYIQNRSKANYNKNKERKKEVGDLWRKKNISRVRKVQSKYLKNRRKIDPSFRLRQNIQNRLSRTLKINKIEKTHSTKELTGLTRIELKQYIELKWLEGMTWENYGFGKDKWNIDHILPCELFDFSSIKQQKICCYYTNLEPTWQNKNFSKNDILDNGKFAKNLTPSEKVEYLKSKGYII